MGDEVVLLSDDERAEVVERRATCPFIASAVAEGRLPVRNSAADPLASIAEVRELGNSGGGDLGDLLVFFASGNHAFMRGSSGRLDQRVPVGLFSLEFPGSQGSHPGHSGILEGDPSLPGSGRLSRADFDRLAARASGGLLRRSLVGGFIAESLRRDPRSKVFGKETAKALAGDLVAFLETTGPALMHKLFGAEAAAAAAHREVEQKLTKLLGEDNLVGSAGEWGLLFAFLANSAHTKQVEGEPALVLDTVELMFVRKRLPAGFDTWPKHRSDWVRNTTALLIAAGKAYASAR